MGAPAGKGAQSGSIQVIVGQWFGVFASPAPTSPPTPVIGKELPARAKGISGGACRESARERDAG